MAIIHVCLAVMSCNHDDHKCNILNLFSCTYLKSISVETYLFSRSSVRSLRSFSLENTPPHQNGVFIPPRTPTKKQYRVFNHQFKSPHLTEKLSASAQNSSQATSQKVEHHFSHHTTTKIEDTPIF